jgi:CHAT domain-containing protein
VISSYTPTISALYRLFSEAHIQEPDLAVPRMLLVAQPTVIGLPSLPNAHVEIGCIKDIIPPECMATTEGGDDISVDEALGALKRAHVLHLACHGHQDQDDPLNSGFDLRDGRLTLGKLMGLHTPHAQFAYLSACDSAGMDESRPDEGLNLVGAMIFVGFKSVVGTMW